MPDRHAPNRHALAFEVVRVTLAGEGVVDPTVRLIATVPGYTA